MNTEQLCYSFKGSHEENRHITLRLQTFNQLIQLDLQKAYYEEYS